MLPRLGRLLLLGARLAAALVMAIGAAVLVGWATDIQRLKDPLGTFVLMMPNSALMLLATGLALGLSVQPSRRLRRAGKVLAAGSALFALATVSQDLFRRDFGIDRLLFHVHPARPAVSTALGELLASVAVLLLDVRSRWVPKPAEVFATAAAALGWLGLGGYLYGAIQFYIWNRSEDAPGMAIHSSVAIIALALGVVAARPGSGAMAIFTSRHVCGPVSRRMLAIVLAIPVLGYFAFQGQRAGLYEAPGDDVVEAVAGMVAAVVITVAIGSSLEHTDARRRRVELESREWKRFFDSATFGAAFDTVDGRFAIVNMAYARMHGYTPAELEGKPIKDVYPAARHAEVAEKIRFVAEQGGGRWETEHLRKDGSTFPVVVDLSSVYDEEGALLYRAAYVQDITDEKEAEADRSRLASLVRSTDDAIVAETLDGTIVDWNRAAERFYGHTAQEMVGRSVTVIVPESRRAEREVIRARALAGETVVGFETERVCKDGRAIPVALTLSPIVDGEGRVVGVSSILRGISTIKQLEREREEWASIRRSRPPPARRHDTPGDAGAGAVGGRLDEANRHRAHRQGERPPGAHD